MILTTDYAQLANHVYLRTDENRTPVPAGWVELGWLKDDALSGFSAGWYQKGSEIAISYTGTNETKLKDAFYGYGSSVDLPTKQVLQAMTLYFKVREQYPSANITFTGHSLGAGLASLMAVYFNKKAVVFDQAPFEDAAKSHTSLLAYSPNFFLDTLHVADPEYTAFYDTMKTGESLYGSREDNVTAYAVENEALAPLRATLGTIGTPMTPIPVGAQSILGNGLTPSAAGMVELHSMTLLAAMLTSASFKSIVPKVPTLLELVFDKSIYARDPQASTESNFIDKLYIKQISSQTTPLLDRFSADLNKIISDQGTSSRPDLHKALIVAAMDYYYLNEPSAAAGLFSANNGGIHFDAADIPGDSAKSLPLLAEALAKLDDKSAHFIRGYAQDATGWHIQSGTGALNWSASSSDNQAAVGGANSDSATGGDGHDLLMGLEGADTLQGKAGSDLLVGGDGGDQLDGGEGRDYLYGGAGSDTYVFTGDFGNDWINDSDGSGQITVDGQTLSAQNAKKVSTNTYKDKSTGWTFFKGDVQTDGTATLVISKEGARNSSITVRNWKSGQMGTHGCSAADDRCVLWRDGRIQPMMKNCPIASNASSWEMAA